MDLFDLLKEYRQGNADIDKAGKAMKVLGWLCLAGAIWNFALYYLGPFKDAPFDIPPNFPHLALVAFLLLSGLFLWKTFPKRSAFSAAAF